MIVNFKILVFWVVRGLKGQKTVQNDKNFCLLHLIFQEPYIIYDLHLWYTCMYKRITSPVIFFIYFQNLVFRVIGGMEVRVEVVKAQKWSTRTKYFVCLTPYLKNRTSYDCDFWYTCVKWWYLQQIFSFSKILRGKKAKIDLKLAIFLYISGTV